MFLENKIALVSGASKGLGAAIATALVAKKVNVYGLGRNSAALNDLHQKLGKLFVPVVLDVREETILDTWITNTFSENHYPQILINNAGVAQFSAIDILSMDAWKNMIDTNLNAVHYLCSKIIPLMKQGKQTAHIINIGSILGKVSAASKGAYSATKYALQGYSEALFKELRKDQIKVTCFNPGSMNTTFFESSGIEGNNNMLDPVALAAIITFILESPDNVLIDELSVRPLNP